MSSKTFWQLVAVLCTFLVALILDIAPWPKDLQYFRPSWLVLVLMYWILAIPNKVNIGAAFVLGIIFDFVIGSVLGVHALIFSIFAYFIARGHLVLRNLSLWFQSILVVFFVIGVQFGIFVVEYTLHKVTFNSEELVGALFSGILWPWLFLLLRKIRRQVKLR